MYGIAYGKLIQVSVEIPILICFSNIFLTALLSSHLSTQNASIVIDRSFRFLQGIPRKRDESQFQVNIPHKLYLMLFLLISAEGVKGFYKGIIPTTAKAVVATAVTFAAYEVTRKKGRKEERKEDGKEDRKKRRKGEEKKRRSIERKIEGKMERKIERKGGRNKRKNGGFFKTGR